MATQGSYTDAQGVKHYTLSASVADQTPTPAPQNTSVTTASPSSVSVDSLNKPPDKPIGVPTTTNTSYLSDIEAAIKNLNAPTATETQSTDIQSRILSSLDKLGTEASRRSELEKQSGILDQQGQLQDVTNQLQALQKEALSIPIQLQKQVAGQGVTAAGLAPIETGMLRDNTINSLRLAAIGQTLQGNITFAQSSIDKALNAEFDPERQKLAVLGQLYTFNKDALDREDKKKSDQLGIYLNERSRVLALQEADKKSIYDIGLLAQQNGADPAITQKIFAAKTKEEAVQAAGSSLQDPAASVKLESIQIDNLLKRDQLKTEALQRSLLQKQIDTFGQPTAAEKKKADEEQATKQEIAKTTIQNASDKITLIDGLLNNPGLEYAVGPNREARKGYFIGLFPGVGLGSSPDALLNQSKVQSFLAGTQRVASKDFVDAILSLKQQGGTLGALNETEGNELRNAADNLNAWAIKDKNGKVTGYEIGEIEFKTELNRIKELSQRAAIKARGDIFDDSENDTFSQIDSIRNDSALIPAGSYYD